MRGPPRTKWLILPSDRSGRCGCRLCKRRDAPVRKAHPGSFRRASSFFLRRKARDPGAVRSVVRTSSRASSGQAEDNPDTRTAMLALDRPGSGLLKRPGVGPETHPGRPLRSGSPPPSGKFSPKDGRTFRPEVRFKASGSPLAAHASLEIPVLAYCQPYQSYRSCQPFPVRKLPRR